MSRRLSIQKVYVQILRYTMEITKNLFKMFLSQIHSELYPLTSDSMSKQCSGLPAGNGSDTLKREDCLLYKKCGLPVNSFQDNRKHEGISVRRDSV